MALKVGVLGSASTVTVGHAAGAVSLCYGCDLAATDHADAVLCLGADSLTDTVVTAYRELGILAGASSNGSGSSGLALAEAGVAVLIERLSFARQRGARIHGEVLGYAITSDARGIGRVDPEGEGLERAMRLALDLAGVPAQSSPPCGRRAAGLSVADNAEAKALERVFGADVKVNSPKLALGEPMGAGASLSIALAISAWEHDTDVGPVLVNSTSLGGPTSRSCLRRTPARPNAVDARSGRRIHRHAPMQADRRRGRLHARAGFPPPRLSRPPPRSRSLPRSPSPCSPLPSNHLAGVVPIVLAVRGGRPRWETWHPDRPGAGARPREG